MNKQDAIGYLEDLLATCDCLNFHCGRHDEAIKMAISALEQQLNGGWIFCEDRMPNVDNIMVLIQDKYGDLALAVYKDGNFYFINHTNAMLIKGSKIKNVVAWHILPKPYKEDKDAERN